MIHQSQFEGFPQIQALEREETVPEQIERLTREKGPLIPQAMIHDVLGLSRVRVWHLIEAGRFERLVIGGTSFVPLAQIVAHKALPVGRPRKAA